MRRSRPLFLEGVEYRLLPVSLALFGYLRWQFSLCSTVALIRATLAGNPEAGLRLVKIWL